MLSALISKELRELMYSPAPVLLLLAVSIAVYLLTSEFISKEGTLKVASVETTCKSDRLMRSLLTEQPELQYVPAAIKPADTYWELMDREQLKLLLVCESLGSGELWTTYATLRNDVERTKADYVLKLLYRSLQDGEPWYFNQFSSEKTNAAEAPPVPPSDAPPIEADPPQEGPMPDAASLDGKAVQAAAVGEGVSHATPLNAPAPTSGDAEVRLAQATSEEPASAATEEAVQPHDDWHMALHVRGGSTRPGSVWLMPGMGLMLSILLTFYLASLTIVKEVSRGTWHLFRLAPTANSFRVIAGKTFLPLVFGALMLAFFTAVGATFDLGIKPQMGGLALAFYLPALIAVAMQGVFASSLLRNEGGALLAGAAYLVGMIMLSGIIVPHDESGSAIQIAGYIFPLTHAVVATQSVTLHGASAFAYWTQFLALVALTLLSTIAAFAAVSMQLRRYA